MARVLVVDDHRAVAESLAMAIEAQPDLACAGTAGTLADATRLLAELSPDILLTDVELPDGDGIEAAARALERQPDLRVIVLTAHTEPGLLARAAAAGVCGFLPKESSVREVLRALRTAREGGMVVDVVTLSAVLARVGERLHPAAAQADQLTPRELEVLRGLGRGSDPQAIATQLGISVHTCRGHVKSILAKLGAHTQLEAVVIALRRGLLLELSR